MVERVEQRSFKGLDLFCKWGLIHSGEGGEEASGGEKRHRLAIRGAGVNIHSLCFKRTIISSSRANVA